MSLHPTGIERVAAWRRLARAASLACLAAALAACGSGGGSDDDAGAEDPDSDSLTVAGDVAIVYAKRAATLVLNPTDGSNFAPGGDLMLRVKSSPSATEVNLTHAITQGAGDASDPEVSYDGKKVVFSLRCPVDNTSTIGGEAACTGRWNLWEYDMSGASLTGGTLRRLTSSTDHDDVDPAYLPAGRGFVFSSNRQVKSRVDQGLGRGYVALDEYERERVLNLHTMKADGSDIRQISFNQSHDRNPVLRPNGDIMFARWEHVADRNRFAIFRSKPDGTDMFVLYGAQSPGNSFLHPRDMDPKGRHKGFVASSLMPLQRTQEGGGLMLIDVENYSEQDTPARTGVPAQGGQRQLTERELNLERGLSRWGRITAPYPLWDGTDRILVAYRPCEVRRAGVIVSCATLNDAEIARLSDMTRAANAVDADELQDDVPAAYAIYMFDPARHTWLVVAAPPAGFMYTDPVALQARTEPNATEATLLDESLADRGLGLLEVRSVYDTDGLNRMGEVMTTGDDRPGVCAQSIAMTSPGSDPLETRAAVPDLLRIKDPADLAYRCAPARFVRVTRGIAAPVNSTGMREAIGDTDFEMQKIVGYAPVEPDGSFKIEVPADTPLAISVLDRRGRAFQTHTNWIQVRPGERRTCDGCHSPRRGASLNSGATVNTQPAALRAELTAQHLSGETMASLRARLDAALLQLRPDPVYVDVWADTRQAGVVANPSLAFRYTANTNPADDLATPVPANGVINYPVHIQPLWTRDRGAATCVNCHDGDGKLDLRGTTGGLGRLVSYESLLNGAPRLDATTGQPVVLIENGTPVLQREIALVDSRSGSVRTAGIARKSRLTEILWGQNLFAEAAARSAHPTPPATAPDHATLLNGGEKRLLAEWMDLGAQYYNDPFTAGGRAREVAPLNQRLFNQLIHPILQASCAARCHQAVGSNPASAAGRDFRENRYVLTGSAEGDYYATLSLVHDACDAGANALLRRPSTVPHPAGALSQTRAVLPVGSASYNTISAWIAQGCR